MGWERRPNGCTYYYRKRRVGGRVVSEFLGAEGSARATIAATLDRLRRERGRADREAVAHRLATLDGAEAEVVEWHDLVAAVARAALEAAGYHRHDRGPWRKRRMSEPSTTELAAGLPALPTDADLSPLAERARKGDREAANALLRVLEGDPDRLIRLGHGNLDVLAEECLSMRELGDNLIARDAIEARLKRLRAELAGPAPTPLERLLVDRVAMTWFQLQMLELVTPTSGKSDGWALRIDRRRDQAHRRFLSSLKALAQVRRLELPALQVNVAMAGGQQVNLAGDAR